MVTYRVTYGEDLTGTKGWVVKKSGKLQEAFVNKEAAVRGGKSLARRSSVNGKSKLIVEKKNGSRQNTFTYDKPESELF